MAWLILSMVVTLFFAPIFGWILALYLAHKIYKSLKFGTAEKTLLLVVLTTVSILPLHSVLVYPLIVQECESNGGEITFENTQPISKNIVIDGYFYNINERYPVADLLLNETVNSIYHMPKSNFGEGSYIKSAAQDYDGAPFILKAADPSNVACGPFYHYTQNHEIQYRSNNPTEKCIAYEQAELTDTYLRVRKITENERPIRTLWHNIEWTKVTYELVSKSSIKKIHEIRDFNYKGLTYPIFINWFSIASYSCKANTDAHITLKKILQISTDSLPTQKTSMQAAKDHLIDSRNSYFGFEFPQEVQKYDIHISDHDNFSSPENPLKINIRVSEPEKPVLLELYANKFAEWNIKPTSNKNIIVTLRSPTTKNKVLGVDSNHVIETTNESYKENHLLKFYSSYFTMLHFESTKNNRYCAIGVRANNIETDLDLSQCTDGNRNIKLNYPNR